MYDINVQLCAVYYLLLYFCSCQIPVGMATRVALNVEWLVDRVYLIIAHI